MEPIAIIGSGCRFPGGVVDADSYWELLRRGTDAITEIPADRWDVHAYYDPDPDAPGKMYTRWGGFIAGIDEFDGSLLEISRGEAATMDPQQRVLLEVTWEALEDAGQVPAALLERPVGVFVGLCGSDHAHNRARSLAAEHIGPYHGIGTAHSLAAGRIAYALGLRGPAVAIDTACSSSLMAVHLACQSLRSGECELALAAGVQLMLAPEVTIWLCKMRALAPDGRCKTFDALANGFVRGEGCGVVVLKRLRDAIADRDPILATIRGSAVNQDGRSAGLTAPNPVAQAQVLRLALAHAGVDPAEVGYVEAHGTGTSLGDPIEVDALCEVYGTGAPGPTSPCHVGSVKTNIGHLEAAAGVAGLIKAALALQHAEIPPHLHLRTLNPMIHLEGTRLAISAERVAWPAGPHGDRHAAVSAFGFSGTNVHVVLGQAPAARPREAVIDREEPRIFPLSAAAPGALVELAARHARALSSAGGDHPQFVDAVHTASVRRQHHAYRRAIVATGSATLVRELERAVEPSTTRGPAKLAFVFSGQGSQWAGMAQQLAAHEPVFEQALARCEELVAAEAGWSLRAELAREPGTSRLHQTAVAQPAIFAVQVALARLLAHWGVSPAVVVGHSVGEIAAAHVAGALELPAALRLAVIRGREMEAAPAEGRMLAVRLSLAELEARLACCPELALDVAALNGPRSTVVAGTPAAVERLADELRAAGIGCRPLPVRYAFHSRLLKPAQSRLRRALESLVPVAGRLTMISTLTGRVVDTTELDSAYWSKQLVRPVSFAPAIAGALALGCTTFVEIGPRPVLLAAVQETVEPSGRACTVLPSMSAEGDARHALRQLLARLYEAGLALDWTALVGTQGQAVRLPRYPWQPIHHPRAPMHPTAAPGVVVAELAAPARELSDRTQPAPPLASAYDLPALTRALVELVGGLLALDSSTIDPRADLFALGADSLVVIDGLQRVRQRFGVSIPLAEVFDGTPSIEALASSLQRRLAAPTDDATVPTSAAPLPVHVPESGSHDEPTAADYLRTLDAGPRAHLADVLRRTEARTHGSQALRERSQPHLADVRSAAGFRRSFPAAVRAKWLATRSSAHPLVGVRSEGARFWDADGNEYVDFAMGFGVHLFGHQPAFLVEALHEQLAKGWQIGPQCEHAGEVASRLCALTSVERATFCSSGTEAVMTALRLARAATGRPRVAMFAGAYHGHCDGVLPAIPLTRGAPPLTDESALVLEYGAPESLAALEAHAHELAAVIVEPVQGRRPELQPRAFLHALRELTARHDIALVFDEVLLGFRIHAGGAQAWFDVRADIVTYGKIVGGGLPIGVIAGRSRYLDLVDGGSWRHADDTMPHAEPIWFAGTFNKNPLTMAAARAVLRHLEQQGPGLQLALNAKTEALVATLGEVLAAAELPIEVVHFGSLFRFQLPRSLELFYSLLNLRGVYAWEGRTFFLSTAHRDLELERLVDATKAAAHELRDAGWVTPAAARAPVATRPPSKRRAPVTLRLLCLPFAGGGARPFASWARCLPPGVELRPVELPGRSAATGPAFTELAPLVDHLHRMLLPELDVPFACFGHSMGALLAFELARALRRAGDAEPVHLFVSGEPAPQLPRPPVAAAELDDDALLVRMAEYGMPEVGLTDPWLRASLLPRLRADLSVCASFRHTPAPPLTCPISVFGGRSDPLARPDELAAWAEHGCAPFRLRMFDGDHFFMRAHEPALVAAILEDLALAPSPVRPPPTAHTSAPEASR
jgi:acyl transferase domain-containing protein/glutamate-1-semialdehyde aminotransferase/surfactin synthase thioesterase subunit